MQPVSQDFVASGKPTYIVANAGVKYLDISDGKRYRQTTIPYGSNWVQIQKEQVFIPITGGGTVTSVGLGVPVGPNTALGVSGSPVTTSGTIQLTFNGAANQYVRGDGTLGTTPLGTVTSVGLNMPSAFTVTNSPVTTSGTLTVTGAGAATDYIRGDGSLAAFPTIPTVTPSALTKTDDTNVTLTLGGSPNTALLAATSLTLGWSGTLAITRGGTGLNTLGSALQYLRVNAGATALEYATLPATTTVSGRKGDINVVTSGSNYEVQNAILPFLLMGC